MRSEEEVHRLLGELEAEADQFEDVYNDNFIAIKSLRWVLGLPAPVDYRRD